MRQFANEMNCSETAFALPLSVRAEAEWAIHWFTPLVKARLCGHAALATAHMLRAEQGLIGTVRFSSRQHGILVTHADMEGSITLDFPAAPCIEVPMPEGLSEALMVRFEATFRTGALGDLLTVLTGEVTVRAVTPDLDAVTALTRREGLLGFIITAPAAETGLEYDFVSRFFAPARGIPGDLITGSAHTVLAPHRSARLGRDGRTGLQASVRTGPLRTAGHGDRVHLTRNAVTVLDGTLHA